jgi:hypothetical protein
MFIKNGDPQPITKIIISEDIDDENTEKLLEKALDDVKKTADKTTSNSKENGK